MFYRLVAAFAVLISVTACQTKQESSPPPRYAVLRFENATGDPALEWMGRGASEILARELSKALDGPVISAAGIARFAAGLGARPAGAPGLSAEREAALNAGATRLISGYVSRSAGGYRIAAQDQGRVLSAKGSNLIEAVSNLAAGFSTHVTPPPTGSEQAVQFYVMAVEGPQEAAIDSLHKSLAADPAFGPAWTMLIRADIAAGDRAAALEAANAARGKRLLPVDLATVNFETASLTGDSGAQLSALREMTGAAPGDPDLPRKLAEAETAAGDFKQASKDWERLLVFSPKSADVLNQLGYTRAWAGDYAGAIAAMSQYAAVRPADANPLDSRGDVEYLFRRFEPAAQSYLRANAIDPEFQSGGELYKAAWARFRSGNITSGQDLFNQFVASRSKKHIDTALITADWMYRTGHPADAIQFLQSRAEANGLDARLKSAYWTQLSVLELLTGDRVAAAKHAEAAGQPTNASMLLVRFASMPSASVAEWQARAERIINGANAQSIRTIALGYALLLDGKKTEARPLWDKIIATAPGNDFFARAVYAQTYGTQNRVEIVPDPNSVNEFAALTGQ